MSKLLKKKKILKKAKVKSLEGLPKEVTDELFEIEEKIKNNIFSILSERNLLSFNAGYKHYSLVFEPNLHCDKQGKLFGQTIFDDGVIKLDPMQDHHSALETLLHEIFHVITELSGLGDIEGKKLSITNEYLVTLITRGLLQAMRLNPEIFEEILDGSRK